MLDTIENINSKLQANEISVEMAVRATISLIAQGKVTLREARLTSTAAVSMQLANVSLREAED